MPVSSTTTPRDQPSASNAPARKQKNGDSSVNAETSRKVHPTPPRENGKGRGGFAGSGRYHKRDYHYHKHFNYSPPPPTNCVVLKNLDYAMTAETLEEVIIKVAGGRKEFVSVTMIEDKYTGAFKGMAFVHFENVAEATAALGELSKMVINERKVFAEYRRPKLGEKEKHEKRVLKKFEHFSNQDRQTFEKDVVAKDENGNAVDKRAAFFAKRANKREDDQKKFVEREEREKEKETIFRNRLLEYSAREFKEGEEVEDLVFEANLTSYERRMVHMLCAELELGHISLPNPDGRRILHVTKDVERKAEWDIETANIKAKLKKEEGLQKRRNRDLGDSRLGADWKKGESKNGGSGAKDENEGIKWFKPRSALGNGTNPESDVATTAGLRAPSYKLYVPPKQPTGPDGTVGFAQRQPNKKGKVDADDGTQTEVADNDSANESMVGKEDKHDEATDQEEHLKGSKHKALNPSVPAFSPSTTQSH